MDQALLPLQHGMCAGRDRDLLFDTGLGHFSLRRMPLVTGRPIVCVASHTHFDHIGSHHEFDDRRVEASEATILADRAATGPLPIVTPPTRCSFARRAAGRPGAYRIAPAPATGILRHGDLIDLGDRAFEVIHTPGHSPGGIALFEARTGILLSGDILYDGPLIDDTYHSDRGDTQPPWRCCAAFPSRSSMAATSRASGRPAIFRSSTSILRWQPHAGMSPSPVGHPLTFLCIAETGGKSAESNCFGDDCNRRRARTERASRSASSTDNLQPQPRNGGKELAGPAEHCPRRGIDRGGRHQCR